jgi:chemotaxis protein MotB
VANNFGTGFVVLKRRDKNKDEEQVHADRYLITYSDLITLLLGLFVILYAVSKVDLDKYQKITRAFSEYFSPAASDVLQARKGILEGNKDAIPEPIIPHPAIKKSVKEITNDAEKALKKYLEKGIIQITPGNNKLVLTLPEKMMFPSGRAEMMTIGFEVMDSLAAILKGMPFQITVDGHTDSQPISNGRYRSNWDLSVARAMNVGYDLMQRGVPENNMIIRGFGSQRPVIDNSTKENRSVNRRVEIIISEQEAAAPSTDGYMQGGDSLKGKDFK